MSKACLRSKRSNTNPPAKPVSAAASPYDATKWLNWDGPIWNTRINCDPRGIMIMKSKTCVKCTTINVSSMTRSRAGGCSCDEECIKKGQSFSASFEFATAPLADDGDVLAVRNLNVHRR